MDGLLDLFDRDRRRNGTRNRAGGLRDLILRLTDRDDDTDRRARYRDDDDRPRERGLDEPRRRDHHARFRL